MAKTPDDLVAFTQSQPVAKPEAKTSRPPEAKVVKPPIVIVRDLQSFRPEDTPDEFIAALAKEVNWQP